MIIKRLQSKHAQFLLIIYLTCVLVSCSDAEHTYTRMSATSDHALLFLCADVSWAKAIMRKHDCSWLFMYACVQLYRQLNMQEKCVCLSGLTQERRAHWLNESSWVCMTLQNSQKSIPCAYQDQNEPVNASFIGTRTVSSSNSSTKSSPAEHRGQNQKQNSDWCWFVLQQVWAFGSL